MKDIMHLMVVYSRTTMRAWFQYRIDAVLRSLAVFLREATGILVMFFTLLKFDTLGGWNIYEMLFLFSILFLTYGIMIIFFTGLRDFGKTVRDGSFDRFPSNRFSLSFASNAIVSKSIRFLSIPGKLLSRIRSLHPGSYSRGR